MTPQRLPQASLEFIEKIKSELPPMIARKKIPFFLGGFITTQALSNIDKAKEGPEGAVRIGRLVVYRTDLLLEWIVNRYGITPVEELKKHSRRGLPVPHGKKSGQAQ